MNKFWKDMGIAFTMGFVVPSVLLSAVVSLAKDNDKAAETEPATILADTRLEIFVIVE